MNEQREKSQWELHVQRWGRGCGSWYCDNAKHVCLFRGTIPCDVLFVGEAPGESEDSVHATTTPEGHKLGKPFIGPAGKLQDRIIAKAFIGFPELTTGFTNLTGCIPRDPDDVRSKAREPDEEEIKTCAPRLQELIRIADGDNQRLKLIVHVGKLSEEWMEPGLKHTISVHRIIPRCQLTHPAAILRADFVKQPMMEQRSVIDLAEALLATTKNLVGGPRVSFNRPKPSNNGKK